MAEPQVSEQPSSSNRLCTLKYRDQVLGYLRDRGHLCGPPLRPTSGPHTDAGQVCGIPGWTLLVRRQQHLDVAGCVDAAPQRAAQAGTQQSAAIVYRRGHGVAEAYVILPLSQFAAMLPTAPRAAPAGAQ